MAEFLPHLLPNEGTEAGKHLGEALKIGAVDGFGLVAIVDEDHHRGDRGVEVERLEVTGDLLHKEVVGIVELMGVLLA